MLWPHILLWGFVGFYVVDMTLKGLLDFDSVRRGFGICGVFTTLLGMFILAYAGEASLATVLPFHICTVSGLFIPIAMRKNQYISSFIFFLGLPCAFAAILFPSILKSRLSFALNLQFMGMHAIIVLSSIWTLICERRTIRPYGGLRAWIYGNALLILAYWVNKWTHGNYMFLAYAPEDSPLSLLGEAGSIPYIVNLELCAFAVILFMYTIKKPKHSLKHGFTARWRNRLRRLA